MKVLELKGYKSLRAVNAFHTLMLGMKMLPAFLGESYESFNARTSEFSDDEKLKLIKEAALFVELQEEEVKALVSFCTDANGYPYQASNINNLSPSELLECVVAVCFEISKIKVDLLSESEKKKLLTSL